MREECGQVSAFICVCIEREHIVCWRAAFLRLSALYYLRALSAVQVDTDKLKKSVMMKALFQSHIHVKRSRHLLLPHKPPLP